MLGQRGQGRGVVEVGEQAGQALVVGERLAGWLAAALERGLDAHLGIAEAVNRGDRALDDRVVGLAQELDDRDQLLPAPVEAGHPRGEQRLGLVAVAAGLAHAPLRRPPVGGPAIAAGEHPPGRVGGVGLARARECGRDRAPTRVVPVALDLLGEGPALVRRRGDLGLGVGPELVARDPGRDQSQAPGRERPPPRPTSRGPLERGEQRNHARPAPARLRLEPAGDRSDQPARHPSAGLAGRPRAAGGHRPEQRARVAAGERQAPEQALPQAHAEGVLIGVGADPEAHVLLWGHVRGGPERAPGDRQLDARVGLDLLDQRVLGRRGADRLVAQARGVAPLARLGDPEVGDPDLAVPADQHVRGLEVAVDDPSLVGGREPAPGEHELGHDLRPRPLALAQPRAQVGALHELHRQVDLAVTHVDVVDGDDVGVAELGQRLGLAEQPTAARAPGDVGLGVAQELERDLAVELGVVGGADQAHPASADRVEDEVATDRGSGSTAVRRAAALDLATVVVCDRLEVGVHARHLARARV